MEQTVGTTANLKIAAAVIGGSAVVALASLGVAISQQSDTVVAGKMNLGSTSTETTPTTAPAVEKASPAIRGRAPFKAKT
jgi:hypothetical protein